jgi:hypothetical protein
MSMYLSPKQQREQIKAIRNAFRVAWMGALLLTVMCVLGGCMQATYVAPDNGGSLTIRKFCWETKIGHLEASNGTSKIEMDNYDSTSQAIRLAEVAVKALGAATASAASAATTGAVKP